MLRRQEDVLLPERVDGGVLLCYLHLHGIPETGPLQLGHLRGHRGAEELRAALLGNDLGQK